MPGSFRLFYDCDVSLPCVDIDIRRTIDVFKVNRIVFSPLSSKTSPTYLLLTSIWMWMLFLNGGVPLKIPYHFRLQSFLWQKAAVVLNAQTHMGNVGNVVVVKWYETTVWNWGMEKIPKTSVAFWLLRILSWVIAKVSPFLVPQFMRNMIPLYNLLV